MSRRRLLADALMWLGGVHSSECCLVKSRPHQQQCRSNIVECYNLNDSFDNGECCFDIVAVFATMLPVSATLSNEILSFRQSRNKLNMFNLFRLCRRTKFYDTCSALLPFVATKSNVASTLLLVWTGLYMYAYDTSRLIVVSIRR